MNTGRILKMSLAVLLVAGAASADTPSLVNYQGRLLDTNGIPVNGVVDISIEIHTNETLASMVYNEAVGNVTVQNGCYSFNFGTNAVAFANALTNRQAWLQVAVDGSALLPRQRLVAVPYAVSADKARMAETVLSVHPSKIDSGSASAGDSLGYDGTNVVWRSSGVPSGAIVLSATASNASLAAAGFTAVTTQPYFSISTKTAWTNVQPSAPWGARHFGCGNGLVFKNRMWVIGHWPPGNDVWSSTNGIDWQQATASPPWSSIELQGMVQMVAFNKMWVMGGEDSTVLEVNRVWYSSDGSNWYETPSPADWDGRRDAAGVVFNDKMWVMGGGGGGDSDVWYSVNGSDWTTATSSAAWTPRSGAAALVYDGKMWLMSGTTTGSNKCTNDVWYSSNGADWFLATNAAPWAPRSFAQAMVYDGKMWIMGGYNNPVAYNDVWFSTNGADWGRSTNSADWAPVAGSAGCVFDDRMWVLGGNDGIASSDDVWRSTPSYSSTSTTYKLDAKFYLYEKE